MPLHDPAVNKPARRRAKYFGRWGRRKMQVCDLGGERLQFDRTQWFGILEPDPKTLPAVPILMAIPRQILARAFTWPPYIPSITASIAIIQ